MLKDLIVKAPNDKIQIIKNPKSQDLNIFVCYRLEVENCNLQYKHTCCVLSLQSCNLRFGLLLSTTHNLPHLKNLGKQEIGQNKIKKPFIMIPILYEIFEK